MSGSRLADRMYVHLLRALAGGRWASGERLPSMREVARDLGTSRTTLQQVVIMAGDQGLLRTQPRHLVEVRPGAAQRSRELLAALSRRDDLRRLAIVVPQERYKAQVYISMATLVAEEAANRHIRAERVSMPRENQAAFSRHLMRTYDAAYILSLLPDYLGVVFDLAAYGFPALLFNRRVDGLALPALNEDDYGAAQQIGNILKGFGHRDACMINTTLYSSISHQRGHDDGWMAFLEQSDLMESCSMPLVYFKRGMFPMVFDRLLRHCPSITAYVLAVPSMAEDVARSELFRQMEVPRDLSLAPVGLMRPFFWPSRYPPLTQCAMDIYRAAQCAVEMIDLMLLGNPGPPSLRVPMKITLTDSIGPAPQR